MSLSDIEKPAFLPAISSKYPLKRHKHSGQAYAVAGGQWFYFGNYDEPKTHQKYHRWVAEMLANGAPAKVSKGGVTVADLVAGFWRHAQVYYKNGSESHREVIKSVLRVLLYYYGSAKVDEFGPRQLKAVRQHWIAKGSRRKQVNKYTGIVRQVFRWGVVEELVPVSVSDALRALENLKKGRGDAKESQKVKPVSEALVYAVEPFLTRPVWGIVRLLLFSAARPGELVTLRPVDIDMHGVTATIDGQPVHLWEYRPEKHKNEFRDQERVIYFGPRAQAVIREFLADCNPAEFLFDPRRGISESRKSEKGKRRRPNQKDSRRKTARVVGNQYTVRGIQRAVARACEKAEIPHWNPYRIRHTSSTNIRAELGLEAAQAALGDKSITAAQIYAEVSQAKAKEAAAKMG